MESRLDGSIKAWDQSIVQTKMVRVLLFAAAREIVGARDILLPVEESLRVSDLKEQLGKRYPDLLGLLKHSRVSIDRQFACEDEMVHADSEVALIPPVSGG
jgi:molybdopterin converting factor small subunit